VTPGIAQSPSPRRTAPHLLVLVFALLGAAFGCARIPLPPPPAADEPRHGIYVVEHGWHAGIVIARDATLEIGLPPLAELPASRYLEIGWGDRDFYRAPAPGLGLALKAGLLPTASVLHLTAFSRPVDEYFPGSAIIRLELAQSQLEALLAHIADSFELDAAGRPVGLGPGLYGDSQFYRSRQRYHLLRTCNVWTAGALRAGGVPIVPATTLSTTTLFNRLMRSGEVVRPRPS